MGKRLKRVLRRLAEINRRYRQPRIAMSFGVRAALMALRLYLFFLVGLIAYKFVLLLL